MSSRNKKPEHRGRIQAQGEGLEDSEAWAQDNPPTVKEGKDKISVLKSKLSKADLEKRNELFDQAEKFIEQAGENGGVHAQVSKSFKNTKKSKKARVDIEVISGRAFTKKEDQDENQ